MRVLTARNINAAEAIFISDISERDVHRIVDENLLSDRTPKGKDKRFDALDLILVSFYFDTANELSKPARMTVIDSFIRKFGARFKRPPQANEDWTVAVGADGHIKVDFAKRIEAIQRRMEALDAVNALVSVTDAFDGEPVFKGTRVPVRTIDILLKNGVAPEDIAGHFPSLTKEMIEAAPLWVKVHPAKGRPRSFGELNLCWKIKSSNEYDFV